MHLVVGLGNPGEEYRYTRHNAGFLAAARFMESHGMGRARARYGGRWCEGTVRGLPVAVLFPRTFMNRSGEAVAQAAVRKHIGPEKIIVVHDDLDFPPGVVRAREGDGSGGHKGLESVISSLGTGSFRRVRIGIGRPEDPGEDPAAWVLKPFDISPEELSPILARAAGCIEAIITGGIEAAMNRFNRRPEEQE